MTPAPTEWDDGEDTPDQHITRLNLLPVWPDYEKSYGIGGRERDWASMQPIGATGFMLSGMVETGAECAP